MAHELAGALQQVGRIRQRCAVEKSHVYVRSEYIDVPEARIARTCHWTVVVLSFEVRPHFRITSNHWCAMAPSSPACSFPNIDAGSRSTAPLNRSNFVLIVAPHQDCRAQTREASTGLSSGSEPIFACTGPLSLKSLIYLSLAADVEPGGRRLAGTLQSAGVCSHDILRATR
jgi:hypothetical protein